VAEPLEDEGEPSKGRPAFTSHLLRRRWKERHGRSVGRSIADVHGLGERAEYIPTTSGAFARARSARVARVAVGRASE
jgi:hypothetical protein